MPAQPDHIEAILQQFPIEAGQCSACAYEIASLFQNAGETVQIGHIETDLPFLSTRTGVRLSRRIGSDLAYHEFVRVGEQIYDALTGPLGITWEAYQALFYEGVFVDGTVRVTYRTLD